jgi:serine/threonine protein kinase
MIVAMAAPDDDDAFAATVAPAPSVVPVVAKPPLADGALAPSIPKDAQTPSFKKVVLGTRDGKPAPVAPPPLANDLSSDATMAAPVLGEEPPLPEVQRSLYETAEEIARGGMGRIVAAEDRRLGRPVALKELLDPNDDSMPRFQREALITARLQHHGIVPVYEAGRWPTGEPFFAMKLVSGRPLDRVIAETETLSERLALLPRLAAACDAIAYAHSQRIIHRDLKPGNVLIGDFGETVVIDWGLAKDLDAADSIDSTNRAPRAKAKSAKAAHETASSTLTVAGSVMGTPAYMAPEQREGKPADARTDVYSFGCLLYEMLTGARAAPERNRIPSRTLEKPGNSVPSGVAQRTNIPVNKSRSGSLPAVSHGNPPLSSNRRSRRRFRGDYPLAVAGRLRQWNERTIFPSLLPLSVTIWSKFRSRAEKAHRSGTLRTDSCGSLRACYRTPG